MVLNLLTETPLLRGLFWTALGVGFWIGGVVLVHYLWKHYRGSEEE